MKSATVSLFLISSLAIGATTSLPDLRARRPDAAPVKPSVPGTKAQNKDKALIEPAPVVREETRDPLRERVSDDELRPNRVLVKKSHRAR
jgi:hypothetical protein